MMRNRALSAVTAAMIWALAGCGGGTSDDTEAAWYRPAIETSWEIQLTGPLNTSYPAQLYDVDLFDTPPETIASLKERGVRVVCYFSAGSYEEWRSDAGLFPSSVLGEALAGWPGERWLDIRSETVRSIMAARMDLAAQKGCDGIDPDNVDGYTQATGFALTAEDQLAYNTFLADEAHKRGLAVGLKNDLGQVAALVDRFDFSINEECHAYNECDYLMPFIERGKPVFNIEYNVPQSAQETLCADAKIRNFRTLIMPDNLDGSFRISCDD